jgi:hypothetical protein
MINWTKQWPQQSGDYLWYGLDNNGFKLIGDVAVMEQGLRPEHYWDDFTASMQFYKAEDGRKMVMFWNERWLRDGFLPSPLCWSSDPCNSPPPELFGPPTKEEIMSLGARIKKLFVG